MALVVFNISGKNDGMKLFSDKADAFYSNFSCIDIVSFFKDACQVEFQHA